MFEKLDECLIKLSHYGLSKFINQSNSNLFSIKGNLFTMAPEILKNEKEIINEKCDIWSLGILIYYMLFKEYPYNGKQKYQIIIQFLILIVNYIIKISFIIAKIVN